MLTQKQENFVNNLRSGMGQREAYIRAGYSTNMSIAKIDIQAHKVSRKPKVSLRIEEMRQAAKSALIADEIERKEILSEVARGKLSQFVDDSGVIDRKKLDSSAIQGVDEQTIMGKMATVIKLRLHNPIQAIGELNKMENVYEVSPPINQDNRTINIFIQGGEEAKAGLERLMAGQSARPEQ